MLILIGLGTNRFGGIMLNRLIEPEEYIYPHMISLFPNIKSV